MNASTFVLLIILVYILLATKQLFWVAVAAILILAYFTALAGSTAKKGVRALTAKGRAVYAGELKELEAFNGKYPSKFFDSVGKGAAEKFNEYQAPKGAKSYRDAENYRWEIKNPSEKIADSANKILDSLGKLFSK